MKDEKISADLRGLTVQILGAIRGLKASWRSLRLCGENSLWNGNF
jgi:hypothetical protein